MKKVLISGGTGLIGEELSKRFLSLGIPVNILSRNPKAENHYFWDIDKKRMDEKAFEGVTHIIHLAGAGIADKRWSRERKQEIIASRVDSANLLFSYAQKLRVKLSGFITASGIGYYGAITSKKVYSEEDNPAKDYISSVCVGWENASKQFEKLGAKISVFRTGIVLSKKGGALQKMNTPIFVAPIGSGKQYMPWIHITDLCDMYTMSVIDSNFSGIYNAIAPEHQTNTNFTAILGKTQNKLVSPVAIPASIFKLAFGELSCILLNGSRVSAAKICKEHQFKHSNLQSALEDIFN